MLNSRFDKKYIGLTYLVLRIKILKIFNNLILSQYHCVNNTLDKFNDVDLEIVNLSIDVNLHISKNNGKSVSYT